MVLILTISIVFDISEKIDDFLERHAPVQAIVFQYYMNFIPYYANYFAPLFVFISVIFFTSKMAANTEIVAILNSGVSFRRMLLPYFISAAAIALISFYFNGWVIPHSNKVRLAFENVYIKNPMEFRDRNIHRQISPGVFMYMESYNNSENIGFRFTLERIENGKRNYYLNADRVVWDSIIHKWRIENYYERTIHGFHEALRKGNKMDTVLAFYPEEFKRRVNIIEAMDTPALRQFIEEEKLHGSENVSTYLIEKYRRLAVPVTTFILTLMGVSLSSRKARGGIGVQLGIGIALSFTYILFMQVSTTFATSGSMPPLIAVWIPNLIFATVGLFLMRAAPK